MLPKADVICCPVTRAEYASPQARLPHVFLHHPTSKSSSTTGHKGYNVYQNIRLGLGQIQEETNYVQDVLIEEYKQLKNSLQEGIINEAGFFSKLKDMSKKFISTIIEFGQRILNWFKEAIEKIKSAASEGIDSLGNVFGFGMDVQTNAD